MPIYDFKCSLAGCNKSVELIVGSSENFAWHPCLQEGQDKDCQLYRTLGAAKTTFKHADKSGMKKARK